MKPVVLTTCVSNLEADLIKLNLSKEGVGCILINEHFTRLLPMYSGILGSGIKVMVAEPDLDKARNIVGLNKQQMRCPECGSTDFRLKNRIWVWALFSAIFGMLMGNLLHDFTCNECNGHFKG